MADHILHLSIEFLLRDGIEAWDKFGYQEIQM